MAANSEPNDNEGWAFKTEDHVPASGESAETACEPNSQLDSRPAGNRSSPRARVNPFLARQHSGDVQQGMATSQGSCMPGIQPEVVSTAQVTGDQQQLAYTINSKPVMPPMHSAMGPVSKSSGQASTLACPAVDSTSTDTQEPVSSVHLSTISGTAGEKPSTAEATSDLVSISLSSSAVTTSVDSSSTPAAASSTSTSALILSTAADTAQSTDPYSPHSSVNTSAIPAIAPPPTTTAATFSLSSPPTPSSSAPHQRPSSPHYSSSPHQLSALHSELGADGGWPHGAASSGDEDWERRPPAERWAPLGERWAPLGANDADDEEDDRDFCLQDRRSSLGSADIGRLRKLEEEQEHLNNSLMALTTHFAQVQFRLRQIVEAPGEEKEQLLRELETFAFRGIPDVRQYKLDEDDEQELTNEWKHQELVETQRIKQRDLMQQLKTQLEDLEHYAYETGEAGLPSSVVLEKQRVIIDELKGKLNIDLNNLDRMTSEDLKSLVDCAVGQLINPLKMKEQLVNQLKTQVQDLERFISFLQGETEDGGCDGSCRRSVGVGGAASTSGDDSGAAGDSASQRPRLRRRSSRHHRSGKFQNVHEETSSMMRRALTLLQLMTLTQFGCGGHSHRFSSNELKKTPRGNHWGDLRARLELAVSAVSELARESLRQQQEISDRGTDDSDAAGPPAASGDRLTLAVRRELAMALRDLMQHGLLQLSKSRSVVPFAGCLPSRQSAPRLLHAWDLILVYYRLKRGHQYNATPQRRLSESFGLSVVGGTAITSKHTLLSAIGNIIASHTPLKRSADAHFKAFVCAGLNARKLSSWLRLILTTQAVTEEYYQPWSYVVSTGFDDGLQCLARLEKLRFALPEDLAVRQLKNIRDAF
ncbi:RUN domain-containing protein 1-like isoform X2 [Amphibalanus amphitrite]|uniref:RUN domain-containing protein 1-like isoform X2 n=1 Tax=Amphibalanus amphitrite TaxID=1232801 RepID=UPI001C907EA4|nr:RUN domain-containing protein 1-like isoform X2 [Amphibalanus amphitrite]